jgi:hypothetical protein
LFLFWGSELRGKENEKRNKNSLKFWFQTQSFLDRIGGVKY